jgi:Domain of unknown function (DUF4326)
MPVGHRKPGRFDEKVRELVAKTERMRDSVACPDCSHTPSVHLEDGTCVVCERTRAASPCFKLRGRIVVAKVHDPIAAGGEYVGRQVRGRRGSPLGNPFKIKTEAERADAIASYEQWLKEKIDEGDRSVIGALDALVARFRAEEHLVIYCWCRSYGQDAPACHADVIARVVRERAGAPTTA